MDRGHGIANELRFGHLLLNVRQVQIGIQQQQGITDSMDNI
jgi:hypothetical protein